MIIHSWIALFIFISCTAARAVNLSPYVGPNLPFQSLYAVFVDYSSQGHYYYLPLTLELAIDQDTKAPRFGVQFATESTQSTKLTSAVLTATFVPHVQQAEISAIKDSLALSNPSIPTTLSPVPQYKYDLTLMLGSEHRPLHLDSGTGSTDSTIAISADLSQLTKGELFDLLGDDVLLGGLIMTISVPNVLSWPLSLRVSPQGLVQDFKDLKSWPSPRVMDLALKLVHHASCDSQICLDSFAAWLSQQLGPPIFYSDASLGIVPVWNLSSDPILKKMQSEPDLDLILTPGIPENPQYFASTTLQHSCATRGAQIVDLNSGKTGCQ